VSLRIGIDIFSFDKPGENYGVGPGVYVWHLLPKLFEYGKDIQFYVFGNKDNESLIPKADNVKIIIDPLPNKLRSFRILHEQIIIPFYTKKFNLDLIHFLGNNISYLSAKKSIITIYDLMWKYYLDQGHKNLKYKYFLLTVPKSIKMARGIITISSFVRQQVYENYAKDLKHIIPILLAPGELKQPNENQINIFKAQYNYKFIFTVTTSLPHKNLMTLLKAFQKLKSLGIYQGKLIVVGQLKGVYHNSTNTFIKDNNLENEIILAGFISEELKTYFYNKADFIVYPSLYEGFGLPVLEAISAGNVVLASNAASIPEVGGDVCLYFDPSSDEDLVNKLQFMVENPSWSDENKEKRLAHFKNFSWDKTAKATLAAYQYFEKQK
jgi:glycosyltransferase involved in cell wall biosynthesis